MSKSPPYMPLYWDNLMGGTTHLNDTEFRCYMKLLHFQWANGCVPQKTATRMNLCGISDLNLWSAIWDSIRDKFEVDDEGNFRNERLEEERAKALRKWQSAVENGKKGGRPKKPTGSIWVKPNETQTKANKNQNQNQSSSSSSLSKKENQKKNLSRRISFDDGDLKFAHWMYGKIKKTAPKAKEPNFETWANTIRLMREQDGLALDEIAAVFKWANSDSFWAPNILSPKKLRDKFATLDARRITPTKEKQAEDQDKWRRHDRAARGDLIPPHLLAEEVERNGESYPGLDRSGK